MDSVKGITAGRAEKHDRKTFYLFHVSCWFCLPKVWNTMNVHFHYFNTRVIVKWVIVKDNHKRISLNEVKLKWVTFIPIDSHAFTVFFNEFIYMACQWHGRRLSTQFTSDKPETGLAVVIQSLTAMSAPKAHW